MEMNRSDRSMCSHTAAAEEQECDSDARIIGATQCINRAVTMSNEPSSRRCLPRVETNVCHDG